MRLINGLAAGERGMKMIKPSPYAMRELPRAIALALYAELERTP